MGFLVAFDRTMYLKNYIHNLETKITDITAQKLDLTNSISQIDTEISDIGDNDSPSVKKMKARKTELENLDKELDVQMQKYQTQLQAANTELQSADQMLQQNVQKSFTYNIG